MEYMASKLIISMEGSLCRHCLEDQKGVVSAWKRTGSKNKLGIIWWLVASLLVRFSWGAALCGLEVQQHNKLYRFSLPSPLKSYPHGILSEDGFYKISETNSELGSETNFWFQLCEPMVFNHDPPICVGCQTCGGPLLCGLTCSALMVNNIAGYRICTTLGYAANSHVSLIDIESPEKGVRLDMPANTTDRDCSFSISVYCNASGVQAPTSVSKSGKCNYVTTMMHPAACPAVAYIGNKGFGWLRTFAIILLCIFAAYLLSGMVYRFFFSWDPWQGGYSKFRFLAECTKKNSEWPAVHFKLDGRRSLSNQIWFLYSSFLILTWSHILGVLPPFIFSHVGFGFVQ